MAAQPVQDPNLSQNLNQPISSDTSGTIVNGTMISGPALPNDSQASTPAPTPTPTPVAPQDQTQPVEEKPKEENGEESPLQALAKKLAALKEDLVEEVPEEPKKEETKVEEIPESTPAPEEKKEEVPVEPVPVEEKKEEASPIEPVDVAPEVAPETTPSVAEPAAVEPVAVETKEETPAEVKEEAQPVIPIVDAPAIPSDMMQTKSTLDELYPEINAAPIAAPQQPAQPATDETQVIDESDNSQVNAEVVEKTPTQGKYPMNINKVMDIAIERNASDIQISVGYPVMIRIDGSLLAINDQLVSKENAEELIMPVLSEQKKELLEVNREVDLAYSPLQNNQARFRINAYFSKGNLTAAFRLIPSRIRTIEELMLPPIYNQLTRLSQGLVLVTGPTGHGKSTTLAAMLQAVNTNRAVHIITIEDPIEYIFTPAKAVIDQREMHDDTHSWTVALKSALRQDPDVILVGEMRDYETIAAAVTLAETGHLVFATLHTNSAAQTVDRIIDVFPENQQAQIRTQLSNIIEAVVAQRLIPIEGGGRRAVSEIMLGTPAVRNLIREGKTHQIDNVIRTSADVGMVSLEQSLVKLVRDGAITMDRAQEYAVHPEEVVRLLKT